MFATVDIPEWVMIPGSEIGDRNVHPLVGHVIEIWRNNVKVEWFGTDGATHIGIYGLLRNSFLEPDLSDWIRYAQILGDIE